eukprot:580248_1
MSTRPNSTKNIFGPPPSIFDNSRSSSAPSLPLNNLFSPLHSPPNSLYSSTTIKSTPNTSSPSTVVSSIDPSSEWGAPPQSQTEPFNPTTKIVPPPPPPVSHFASHKLLQTSHGHLLQPNQRIPQIFPPHHIDHNSFNFRPPPPPPHHQSLVLLSNNNMISPLRHNNIQSIHNINSSKKRKRSPTLSSTSDRNVKRRVDGTNEFDYNRKHDKTHSRRCRKFSSSPSRSRSPSNTQFTSHSKSSKRDRSAHDLLMHDHARGLRREEGIDRGFLYQIVLNELLIAAVMNQKQVIDQR